MGAEKFSASMDARTLADVRAAAAEEGMTLSSWLAAAARDRLRLRGLRRAIAEYEAEHGEITDGELAAVRREVGSTKGPSRRRRRAV